MKTCPNCAATDLPDKAKVCGHCGTGLLGARVADTTASQETGPSSGDGVTKPGARESAGHAQINVNGPSLIGAAASIVLASTVFLNWADGTPAQDYLGFLRILLVMSTLGVVASLFRSRLLVIVGWISGAFAVLYVGRLQPGPLVALAAAIAMVVAGRRMGRRQENPL